VFRGDALEVGVAAVTAARIEGETEGHWTGVKALFARFAAPRENVQDAEEIVCHRAPLGTANFAGAAAWAGNVQGSCDAANLKDSIGEGCGWGKGKWLGSYVLSTSRARCACGDGRGQNGRKRQAASLKLRGCKGLFAEIGTMGHGGRNA
jgi:hypothetical protein